MRVYEIVAYAIEKTSAPVLMMWDDGSAAFFPYTPKYGVKSLAICCVSITFMFVMSSRLMAAIEKLIYLLTLLGLSNQMEELISFIRLYISISFASLFFYISITSIFRPNENMSLSLPI